MMKACEILALYRSYVRSTRRLPHVYLRCFFRAKASDDFRRILSTTNAVVRKRKLKRVSKDLVTIQAATDGEHRAFNKILEVAYGRKGKLRWELMKPLLVDPTTPLPPRIIPAEPKSHPPTYTSELSVLLTSAMSRTTKPLDFKYLHWPPKLPQRADPTSEDAKLLGPFSKRREVNLRWRHFTSEWKKVRPPLQQRTARGMESIGILEELEGLTGPAWIPRSLTKRQKQSLLQNDRAGIDRQSSVTNNRLPHRWLRRRYQELLGKIPILSPITDKRSQVAYSVDLSAPSIAPSLKFAANRLAEADNVDLCWFDQPAGSIAPKHKFK